LYAEIPGLCHLIRLDQQLAFDPCLTCTPCVPLAQTARRDQSDSGSGLTTNRANQTTPRDSNFAFDVSCSPQPAARFRPLPPLQVSRPRCRRQICSACLAACRTRLKTAVLCLLWRLPSLPPVSRRLSFPLSLTTVAAISGWNIHLRDLQNFRPAGCQAPSLLALSVEVSACPR